ncbi:hypothetical protein V6N11_042646 [Hibiscus sabdariffa]|uniref:Uncharacterized protein n=1 Tax=Hibiscus sabdariffa TaxID=183260 RepID=A0ABR2QX30_9ROSI
MHLKFGALSHIAVSSPEAANQVMKTHDIDFATRPYLAADITTYDFSDIIFGPYEDIAFEPYGCYSRQLQKVCRLELFVKNETWTIILIKPRRAGKRVRANNLTPKSTTRAM